MRQTESLGELWRQVDWLLAPSSHQNATLPAVFAETHEQIGGISKKGGICSAQVRIKVPKGEIAVLTLQAKGGDFLMGHSKIDALESVDVEISAPQT